LQAHLPYLKNALQEGEKSFRLGRLTTAFEEGKKALGVGKKVTMDLGNDASFS
jgi:hypothetical protein